MNILEKIRLKVQEPIAEAPVKIAFLGDSVTHGCFEIIHKQDGRIDCVYDQMAGYPSRLKRKIETVFPNCPVAVINAGISGGTAPQGASRVQRDVISAEPDLAIVCFGLNDALQDAGIPGYTEGLRSIFSQLREEAIDCVFMTPNMMCPYVCPELTNEQLRDIAACCARVQNEGTMDAFMEAAKEVCREEYITVCDCYSDWKRLQSLQADITYLLSNYINHPTREMHELFADRLFDKLFLKTDK